MRSRARRQQVVRARARAIGLPGERQVRMRPPIDDSAATTAATAPSTSGSVSVRSGAPNRRRTGEALLVGGERDAAVDVEQVDVAEQRAGVRADDRPATAAAGVASGDDDREVAVDLREAAHGRRPFRREAARREALDGELGDDDPTGRPELPGVDDRRVELADDRVEAAADRGARAVRPGWNTGSAGSAA